MVNNYTTYSTSIGTISIESTLEHATSFGGILPLLDYVQKIQLKQKLDDRLTIGKQGGIFALPNVALILILGRILGIERISHFEDVENEIMLKRFFKWDKLPDYTTYYNDLNRFEKQEDIEGLAETNKELTKRILSQQDRVILDFDSSVYTVYGNQEGAEVGYNASHPGKKASIPYMCLKEEAVCVWTLP
ncbi:transposase [Oceanobacillus locisalsi]|uniref:Transposase n=1 Tax=Oceanobacillus locisalsi TaxID=546107 RepID=A0ABW3NLN4_9BACI